METTASINELIFNPNLPIDSELNLLVMATAWGLVFVIALWWYLTNKTSPAPSTTTQAPSSIKTAATEVPWSTRLRQGLERTRSSLSGSLANLFQGSTKLNDELLEKIHEILYRADVGTRTADRLVKHLGKTLAGNSELSWPEIQEELKSEINSIFAATESPMKHPTSGPLVILVIGVNGVGKTTTIAKIANQYVNENKRVLLCAADTYRAAAIDQLKVWGERVGAEVIAHQPGSDPASVAYDGVKAAIARKADVLLIDTAGRLHNKKELMAELEKINRVIGKDLPEAPHESWLVIDATTGQNAIVQIQAFHELVKLSGLVVTKLDGTAKGGVVIAAADRFKLPIRYIGVGEKAGDLRPFKGSDYADSLFD